MPRSYMQAMVDLTRTYLDEMRQTQNHMVAAGAGPSRSPAACQSGRCRFEEIRRGPIGGGAGTAFVHRLPDGTMFERGLKVRRTLAPRVVRLSMLIALLSWTPSNFPCFSTDNFLTMEPLAELGTGLILWIFVVFD